MKKLLIALVAATVALSAASAKKWTNNVGVGFTLPISQIGVDQSGADDIFQIGYGVEGTYVGIHEKGFTAKADFDFGLATSKDISFFDDDTNYGVFIDIALGAGYSFVRTEKFTLSATAMLGFDVYSYGNDAVSVNGISVFKNGETTDDKTYDSIDRTISMGVFSVGADLFASYRIKEHFGFFANLSARYVVVGGTNENVEWTYKENGYKKTESGTKDGPDLAGKFRIQPTIGVVWNF